MSEVTHGDAPSALVARRIETPLVVEKGEHLGLRSGTQKVTRIVDLTKDRDYAHHALPERFSESGSRLFELADVDSGLLREMAVAFARKR